MIKVLIKWIAVLAVIVLLVSAGLSLYRGVVGMLSGADFNAQMEEDPMFFVEPDQVTRPPDFDAEATQKPHKTLDDHIMEVETPVDKTAAELIAEAEAKAASKG